MESQFVYLLNSGVEALCKRDRIQACHMCQRIGCGDNTNPLVKELVELRASKPSEPPDSGKPTDNSDYTTAIRVIKDYCQSRPDSSYVGALRVWCEDRLNPAKRDFV